jgi:predicted Rossmann fold nucleotide-binding protein DprA/Smf involved in DNA uptake
MKNLKQDLKAVNKELKALVKKTESLMKAVDRIEKAQAVKAKKANPKKTSTPRAVKKVAVKKVAAKKVVAKNAPTKKKNSKLTATDKVMSIINRSKKGVSVQVLIKKTGFDQRKIANILFRISKMGKIKSVSRGVYVGA